MVHKLPQVLRLHLKRFRYDDVALLIHLYAYTGASIRLCDEYLVVGPQVVWAEPPGEDRSPRELRPASQHGALLLPGALAQSCVLLQSQQPQLPRLAAPQALPLRPFCCGDASWEGLWFWPLHLLLLQHRRR